MTSFWTEHGFTKSDPEAFFLWWGSKLWRRNGAIVDWRTEARLWEMRVSQNIVADLWRKLAFIASMAAGCGLSRTSIGSIRSAPYGRLLFERAVKEVLVVGKARGVPLDLEADAARILAFVDGLGAPMKPSLLLDLEARGRTEVDDLSGAVSRLGREVGVETPIHDTATAALSAGNLP